MQKNRLITWLSFFFPWIPFLSIYSFGKLTIFDSIVIVGIICCLMKTKGVINITFFQEYLWFFGVISVLHFIAFFRHSDNASWLNNYIFCTLIMCISIILFPQFIDEKKFFKSYCIAGGVALAGLLFHSIQVYIFKKPVSTIVLFPSLIKTYDQINIYGLMRPMSFFSEPQAYISFMTPLYILLLTKRKMMYAILVAVSFLLSTSSTGILVVATLTFIWGIKYVKNTKYKLIFWIMFLVAIYSFMNLDIFEYSMDKLLNIDVRNNVRISNGFDLFNSLSFGDKVLGIGGGNSSYYWGTEMSNATYTSSFSKILIEYGYLGAGILITFLTSQFMIKDEKTKLFIIYIAVVMFGQTILFNSWQLFTFVVMYLYIRKHILLEGE